MRVCRLCQNALKEGEHAYCGLCKQSSRQPDARRNDLQPHRCAACKTPLTLMSVQNLCEICYRTRQNARSKRIGRAWNDWKRA